jgi:hypothetical protein
MVCSITNLDTTEYYTIQYITNQRDDTCHKQRKIELAGIEPAWPLDHRALLTFVWQCVITPATPWFGLGPACNHLLLVSLDCVYNRYAILFWAWWQYYQLGWEKTLYIESRVSEMMLHNTSTGSLGAEEYSWVLWIPAWTCNPFNVLTQFQSAPQILWSTLQAHQISGLWLQNPCWGLWVCECSKDFWAPVEAQTVKYTIPHWQGRQYYQTGHNRILYHASKVKRMIQYTLQGPKNPGVLTDS